MNINYPIFSRALFSNIIAVNSMGGGSWARLWACWWCACAWLEACWWYAWTRLQANGGWLQPTISTAMLLVVQVQGKSQTMIWCFDFFCLGVACVVYVCWSCSFLRGICFVVKGLVIGVVFLVYFHEFRLVVVVVVVTYWFMCHSCDCAIWWLVWFVIKFVSLVGWCFVWWYFSSPLYYSSYSSSSGCSSLCKLLLSLLLLLFHNIVGGLFIFCCVVVALGIYYFILFSSQHCCIVVAFVGLINGPLCSYSHVIVFGGF